MDANLLPVALLITAGFVVTIGVIVYLARDIRSKSGQSQEIVEWLKQVSTRVETSNDKIDRRLDQTMMDFNRRLETTSNVISQVQKSIGEFSEIGRSMADIQNLLKSPKLRGGIGEQVLANILQDFLPNSMYQSQFSFRDGAKVDFLIETQKGFIPIDSKFPVENYQKFLLSKNEDEQKKFHHVFIGDVKSHIKSIGEKYIKPDEGTIDYAVMYVPSESVYYEIISTTEIYDFSKKHRILLVSPMSFYAFLRVLLVSFEGERIEEKAKEILSVLRSLEKDYKETNKSFDLLQKHMTNAFNQLALVTKNFLGFGQKLNSTRLLDSKSDKLSSS